MYKKAQLFCFFYAKYFWFLSFDFRDELNISWPLSWDCWISRTNAIVSRSVLLNHAVHTVTLWVTWLAPCDYWWKYSVIVSERSSETATSGESVQLDIKERFDTFTETLIKHSDQFNVSYSVDYNLQAAILLLHVLTTILTFYYDDFYLNSVYKSEMNHASDVLFVSVAVRRLSKLIFNQLSLISKLFFISIEYHLKLSGKPVPGLYI